MSSDVNFIDRIEKAYQKGIKENNFDEAISWVDKSIEVIEMSKNKNKEKTAPVEKGETDEVEQGDQ